MKILSRVRFTSRHRLTRALSQALCVLGLAAPTPDYGRNWTIADAKLQVDFDDRAATFAVRDKTSGQTWRQLPARETFTVQAVEPRDGRLQIRLKGQADLQVTLALTADSDLAMTITADLSAKIATLGYPARSRSPRTIGT
jgi:hypothetical protein